MWSVARTQRPRTRNGEFITIDLEDQVKKYDWAEVRFPTPIEDIVTSERNNNIGINVIGVRDSSLFYVIIRW
jgi:predicted secreted protein